jgi:hypothetical protein
MAPVRGDAVLARAHPPGQGHDLGHRQRAARLPHRSVPDHGAGHQRQDAVDRAADGRRRLFETGAGGSAPKHVSSWRKRTTCAGIRWASSSRWRVARTSGQKTGNAKAKVLAETLDEATGKFLDDNNRRRARSAGRRTRRRRDDPDHLAVDQGQADPALPRHRSEVLRPGHRAPRPDRRPGDGRRRQRDQAVRRRRQVRDDHAGRGARRRNSSSRRCGSRPTARSATSSAAPSSASRSSAATCRAWCPAGPSRSSSAATPSATSIAPPIWVPGKGKLTMTFTPATAARRSSARCSTSRPRRRDGHVQPRRIDPRLRARLLQLRPACATGRSICRPRTPSSRPMTAASRRSSRTSSTSRIQGAFEARASPTSIA